ncbi:Gfo/Idh/MocA family protein [Litchfieldella xinjiangensis]|uniref:Gfo/Idh/MocA family protein n=1 Tax=Litchfieldella xinjiangensis TaxID=1166948 RepID=UPI0005BA2269|nr:Gfo/Idh/MocA family oxidoreductase [Halomonas xinjiangensis]
MNETLRNEAPRRLRLAMIGGGQGALIGGVHRIAARMDARFELIAGAFSSQPERNQATARELGVDEARCYSDYQALLSGEAGREDGADVIAIVTPNHLHFPAALACLEAGKHVICEKPMTLSVDEAQRLADAVSASGKRFVLMHNYVGYPLVQHARELVSRGELGRLRSVHVEYVQEWLSEAPDSDNRQAAWRMDPTKAGAAGCLGDIGVHAFHLAQFICGQRVSEVSAELFNAVAGRELDDNVHALLRFADGARGMLWASQTAPGFENALSIRVVGERASLRWAQESPNDLTFAPLDGPAQRLTRRDDRLGADIARGIRVPGGHPEGYLEAFANLYQALSDGLEGDIEPSWLPGVEDGVDGMRFIAATLASSRSAGAWTPLDVSQSPRGDEP